MVHSGGMGNPIHKPNPFLQGQQERRGRAITGEQEEKEMQMTLWQLLCMVHIIYEIIGNHAYPGHYSQVIQQFYILKQKYHYTVLPQQS